MASGQVLQLVKMANQIAVNLGADRDAELAARRTEDHIRRFWTPVMCAQLAEYGQAHGADLSPVLTAVIQALAVTSSD